MRILAVSDEAMRNPDSFAENMLATIDCVLSCGDLPADYLTFFADRCKGPVLYVHGNHDKRLLENPPAGCICIEDKIYVHHGVRILGLGGCMRYNSRVLQYSQREMSLRAIKMKLPILVNGGFDILLAHAPAEGIGDLDDPAHIGFRAFRRMLEQYRPKVYVHGHIHMRYGNGMRERIYRETRIINACGHYIFEM